MQIEICANGYQSALNAQEAGADRIELCSELAVGGITPSYGLIKKVKQDLKIPVHVLIRPRSGNFTYSDAEFEIMKQDIELCKNLGCEGVVSGVLNADNTINIKRNRELVELAKPMSFTFHRAFDWVENPLDGLEHLIEIRVDRILTSGQENESINGITLLKKLKDKANHKIEIMPGGGINLDNILDFKNAGFKEVHFSATTLHQVQNKVKVSMNSKRFFDETLLAISDVEKIKKNINLIKNNGYYFKK
ncbi:copper homeostasis protein CutC [Aureibaculum sp. 2210JD6-5]|uniref:copper homeostasis protein CutC n=1 Tax=Aureibaculum sp. 2210JD6-5 TaxID=3103957 RepID=UPI002AADF76D|nr:copper homeostasis protein CutC [Aureibaculum sp. 2210JD6-5]MDY7396034.1 copper homeostasis protein CutC [Aureibaculum sp. 2210JD6-5]